MPSVEAMDKTLQDSTKIDAPVASLRSLYLKSRVDAENTVSTMDAASSIFSSRGWKSDEIKGRLNIENGMPVRERGLFKKSQSLGSGLCNEGTVLSSYEVEEEIDRGFSSDSHDGSKNLEGIPHILQDSVPRSESAQVDSDLVNDRSIFSIGDPLHLEKESLEKYETSLSGENAKASGNQTPSSPRMVIKSRSLPNMRFFSAENSRTRIAPRTRSCENMHALHTKWREVSFDGVQLQQAQEQDRKDDAYKTDNNHRENTLDDGFDSCNYSASAKDWIIPVPDELINVKQFQGESSIGQGDEGKDFKFKRIEEWVNDLQLCNPLEEINEQPSFTNISPERESTIAGGGLSTSKIDNKVTPGMEAAKRYISSLNAASTTAQLSNHGLAVIPFLSAFVSLRVLNLSGNSIGLHFTPLHQSVCYFSL